MSRFPEQLWYDSHPVGAVLAPLGWLYRAVSDGRRLAYRKGLIEITQLPVPVIVVGNITVGGTGKTPVVIAIAAMLKACGHRPGIVTRGYRGRAASWPQTVTANSDPHLVGDEPVLLAQRTGCPVVAAPERVAAARQLVELGCSVIVSDDGLQHYRLGRDIEIAVVDGKRRHGNGRCLPAGPLRETPARLRRVDFVLTTGAAEAGEWSVRLRHEQPAQLGDPSKRRPWRDFVAKQVHAVAGIAHPQRFFSDLEAKGLLVDAHTYPDHHEFTPQNVTFDDTLPIFMTEKDAVKCRPFADARHWFVPVNLELPPMFDDRLLELLTRSKADNGQKTTRNPRLPRH
jgi:tetraacyldisaccharide 4'-kinase